MAGFPWSELGLDGPADERTIRRAYASRLKIVRPDVDAAGFQRLVEARDLALRAIEQTALLPSAGLTPRASLVPKREEPVTQGHTPLPDTPEARTRAPLYSIEPETSTSTTEADEPKGIQPAETSVPIEIELSAGSRSAPAAPQRRPSQQARPVAIDIDPPKPPPTVTEPDAKPPLAEPWTGNQVSEAARAEAVVRLLSAFIDAWSRNLDLPPVAPILKLLGEQSIVARQKFEIEALRAVATLLDKGLFDKGTPRRREAARSLIAGLDDDYAWTNNDRRLYMMMPQTTADKIGRLLRVVREWEKTGVAPNFAPSSHAPPRQQPTLD